MTDLAMFADFNEALAGAVNALGGSKKVGTILRPEWKDRPEAASQWLRDCLNAAKPEKLHQDQILMLLRLAKAADYHATKHWIDAEVGYEQGKPISPMNEAAKLQRQVIEAAHILKESLAKLEKLTQATPLQSLSRAA